MAQWVKSHAARPDELSSVPKDYMLEEEIQVSHVEL